MNPHLDFHSSAPYSLSKTCTCNTKSILQYTMYSKKYSTVQCQVYSGVQYTMCRSVQSVQYSTVHSIQYSVHSTSTPYTLYSEQCTAHTVLYTLQCVLYSLPWVLPTFPEAAVAWLRPPLPFGASCHITKQYSRYSLVQSILKRF